MQSSPSRPAFNVTDAVPAPVGRDCGNLSSELDWENYPADTKAFSLVVEYPDAPAGNFD